MNIGKSASIISLILIIIFGAAIRYYQIDKNPTWWDEHANVFTASGILVEDKDPIRSLRIEDNTSEKIIISENQTTNKNEILSKAHLKNIFQASIYWDLGNGLTFTIPLHFWLNIFGYSDAAIRALSCLFGILVIPVGYAVAKKYQEADLRDL
jgi:uncharacterized membrane protein